jgi:hypothetical protein
MSMHKVTSLAVKQKIMISYISTEREEHSERQTANYRSQQ